MRTWSDVRGKIKSITDEEKSEIELSANLVAKLIARREELGLSQRQLSLKSGLKQAAIARLESYNAIPRIDTFARLTKSLGLEIQLVAATTSKEKY
ncbi:MAG: helix-turn-helix domain protein [Firmicutes bacterium]|nr:helix-turn-helix domain protein [Bacillota bacterium]